MYLSGNAVLCKGCLCYGNRTAFTYNSTSNAKANPTPANIQQASTDIANTVGMSLTPAAQPFENFQDCPGVNQTLASDNVILQNITENVNFGVNALGAIEYDLKCAGFCTQSPFYTFSNVTWGPTYQNCSIAIENFAENAAHTVQVFNWITFSIVFLSALYLTTLWFEKYNQLHSPLLGK